MASVPQIGSFPEYNPDVSGFNIPSATLPQDDPRLLDLQTQQNKLAGQFRSNIPANSDQLTSQYAKQARQGLAGQIQNTRASFNRRGLLNSGKRVSSELGEQANTTNNINTYRSNLNNNLNNTANQMDFSTYDTGLMRAGLAPAGLGNSALGAASTNLNYQGQAQAALTNSLAQAGQGIGTVLGNLSPNGQMGNVANKSQPLYGGGYVDQPTNTGYYS